MLLRLLRTPPGVQLFTVVLSESTLNEARLRDIQRVPAALLGIVASTSSSTTTTAPFSAAVLKTHQGYLHPAAIHSYCVKNKRDLLSWSANILSDGSGTQKLKLLKNEEAARRTDGAGRVAAGPPLRSASVLLLLLGLLSRL